MRATHHLLRHPSGVYHFRLIVPPDLHSAVGLRVIKRSLRTRNTKAAQVGAWRLAASYARAFAVLRGSTMSNTKPPPLSEILASVEDGQGSQYVIDRQGGRYEATDKDDHERLKETLQLAAEVARAEAEAELAKQATYDARARAFDAEAAARADMEAAQLQAFTAPIPAGRVFSAEGFTVRQMIEHWQQVGVDTIDKETVKTRLAILNHFAEHFGPNKPISAVRKTDVAAWTAHLAQHGMDGQPNDKTTRNGKCSHVRALFECAINTGHYDPNLGNPANRVEAFARGEKARLADQRGMSPFTKEQLLTLFDPENLVKVEMPHSRRAMILGLYTGARVSEIASIHLDQFKSDAGVHYLHLRGEKSESSERTIPLHQDLIRLGVLDWVAQEKKAKSLRLFPGVNIERKSKGGAISSATSNILKALDIRPDNRGRKEKRLGFHSFRSTVIQALQSGGEEFSERRHAYVGHTREDDRRPKSVQRQHYMRKWTPAEVSVLLERLNWGEWLDFEQLKALLAQREPDHVAIAAKRNANRLAARASNTSQKANK